MLFVVSFVYIGPRQHTTLLQHTFADFGDPFRGRDMFGGFADPFASHR